MRFSIGGIVFEVKNADQKILDELQIFKSDEPFEHLIDLDNSQMETVDNCMGKRHYLYTETTKYLFSKGVVRIHSSAIEYKGKAYAFGAPSGTGKSTHASLWNGFVGARYINDDQPFYDMGDKVTVYPSPWAGKHCRYSEVSAPLQAFVIIKQAKQNKIERLNKKQAILYLYKQIVQPKQDLEREKLLEYMQILVEKVPFYLLECDKTLQAFKTSFEALTGEKYEN